MIFFIISFGLTYMVRLFAIKKSLLAIPGERSSHTIATPYGGGIAIAITWIMGLWYLYMSNYIDHNLFLSLMIGIPIFITGYIDDLYKLSPKIRIVIQSLAAIGGLYILGGLSEVNLVFYQITNPFIVNSFAFLMILWFINLYNFMDGIDGYAGSEAIFLSISGLFIFGGEHFIVLIVSVLGFLVWNWHKAKIFMGDAGSTLLGYVIAIYTIYYANQESNNLWIWIILFGLFWFDATVTLFRRYQEGEKLSQGHRKHSYQRLTQVGWSHSKVVIASIVINLLLLCLVYFVPNITIALLLALLLLYTVTKLIDKQKKFS